MQKYPNQLRTRVSDKELQIINRNAEKAGMSVCAFLREKAIGDVHSMTDIDTIKAIDRFGRMIKNLRFHGPLAEIVVAELRDLKEIIKAGKRHEDQEAQN